MKALLFFLGTCCWAFAQQGLPVHHLYKVTISDQAGSLSLGDPVKLTTAAVYQNQPEFLANGDLLFTAFDPASNQTDIMRYQASDGNMIKQLATPLSEYSPTLTPDGVHFSVVRVEQDNSQKLYRINLASGQETPMIAKASRVGYHAWLPQNRIALFVVAPRSRLVIYDAVDDDFHEVFENVGRCIKLVPDSDYFSTVHKARDDEWFVRAVKGLGEEIVDWFPTLPGAEDYVWLDGQRMLMAKDGAVHVYSRNSEKGWQLVRDFQSFGIGNLTRMALDRDGKTLVMVEGVN